MFPFATCCCKEQEQSGSVAVPVGDDRSPKPRHGNAFAPALVIKEDSEVADGAHHSIDAAATTAEPVPTSNVDEEPPDGPDETTVTLNKAEGGPIGLRLELFENSTPYIAEVEASVDTVVGRHNSTSPEGWRFRVGDYIIAVDGHRERTEIYERLRSQAKVNVRVKLRKPKFSKVAIEKNGLPWGLTLKYDKQGDSILIVAIEDGGATHVAQVDARAGDRICAVNSRSGSVMAMLAEMRSASYIELMLARP
mmetsp:Transcript_108071/g.312291  ORF Transcript_108071/g.312291 Transcript_108071/m.312291 type:complete len:251 (-) Transcript_108071:128-880(-)